MAKKSFILRINPETMKILEKWAEDEFRSVNGQIEYLLHKAIKESKRAKLLSPDNLPEDTNPPDKKQ